MRWTATITPQRGLRFLNGHHSGAIETVKAKDYRLMLNGLVDGARWWFTLAPIWKTFSRENPCVFLRNAPPISGWKWAGAPS